MGSADLRLMEVQVETLFTHDAHGCMCRTREPNGRPAPALFLGRTREGNIWRFRKGLPEGAREHLEHLACREPVSDDLGAEPQSLAAYVATLEWHSIVPQPFSGPAYRFPESLPLSTNTTRITPTNVGLVEHLGPDWASFGTELPFREPCWAVVENGRALSVCFSARLGNAAAEAGVETIEAHRGRGLAGSVISAWARSVRAMGLIPLYSTSWDNLASQAVARKLGLTQYGTDFSM